MLKQVLAEPRHPAYLVMMEILRTSPRMAIIRLVLNLLENRFAPPVALHVVAHRTDLPFVRKLLKRVGDDMPEALEVEPASGRVGGVVCRNRRNLLDALTEKEEASALLLAISTSMNRLHAFEVLQPVLTHGRTTGRRIAAAALSEFGGAEANQLVLPRSAGRGSAGAGQCGRPAAGSRDSWGHFAAHSSCWTAGTKWCVQRRVSA